MKKKDFLLLEKRLKELEQKNQYIERLLQIYFERENNSLFFFKAKSKTLENIFVKIGELQEKNKVKEEKITKE